MARTFRGEPGCSGVDIQQCHNGTVWRWNTTTQFRRCPSGIRQPSGGAAIFSRKPALLTLPWVFVLWFAAFCGVVLITAGLIGSSR